MFDVDEKKEEMKEKMMLDMCDVAPDFCEKCCLNGRCPIEAFARNLVEKGYCKLEDVGNAK